jgi:hypothetical protein
MSLGHGVDRIHLGGHTEHVNRDDSLRLRCDRPLQGGGIHVEGVVYVDDHRRRAGLEDRLDRGYEGERLRDYLVPWLDA